MSDDLPQPLDLVRPTTKSAPATKNAAVPVLGGAVVTRYQPRLLQTKNAADVFAVPYTLAILKPKTPDETFEVFIDALNAGLEFIEHESDLRRKDFVIAIIRTSYVTPI